MGAHALPRDRALAGGGLALNRARRWLADDPTALSAAERSYIQASIAQASGLQRKAPNTPLFVFFSGHGMSTDGQNYLLPDLQGRPLRDGTDADAGAVACRP
jgi:hypothetical protein